MASNIKFGLLNKKEKKLLKKKKKRRKKKSMAKVHVDVYVIPYLVNRMLINKK